MSPALTAPIGGRQHRVDPRTRIELAATCVDGTAEQAICHLSLGALAALAVSAYAALSLGYPGHFTIPLAVFAGVSLGALLRYGVLLAGLRRDPGAWTREPVLAEESAPEPGDWIDVTHQLSRTETVVTVTALVLVSLCATLSLSGLDVPGARIASATTRLAGTLTFFTIIVAAVAPLSFHIVTSARRAAERCPGRGHGRGRPSTAPPAG